MGELTTMSLVFTDGKGIGRAKAAVTKLHDYPLPISPVWLARRTISKKRFVLGLRIGGPILILIAAIAGLMLPAGPSKEISIIGFGLTGGIATLWGLLASFMKGFVDPKSLKAGFSADKATLVFMDGLSPAFLDHIPVGEGNILSPK